MALLSCAVVSPRASTAPTSGRLSVLATIGLTIPAVLVLGALKCTPTILGLGQEQMVLLAVALVISTLTFGGDRTNMLGAVHIVMFLVFGLLLFFR